jgi:hypothetical protein
MMKKETYQRPLLRVAALRSDVNFLATTDGNISDWGEDMEPIDF